MAEFNYQLRTSIYFTASLQSDVKLVHAAFLKCIKAGVTRYSFRTLTWRETMHPYTAQWIVHHHASASFHVVHLILLVA